MITATLLINSRRSMTNYNTDTFYTVSLRMMWHNFTNSQHLLFIFGRESLFNSQLTL